MSSLTIDKTDFTRGLADARAEGAKGVHVPVVFDISQASVSKAVSTSRRLFAASPVTVAVTFGISQASVSRALTASRALFTAKPLAVPVSFSVSQAAVTRAMATARALFAARPLVVPVSFSVSAASVTKTVASARALFAAKPVTVPVSFSTAGMATATAAAAGLATATTAAGNAARSTHTAWGALTGVLTKQIPLFGLMKGEILASDSALTGFLKTIGNSAPHILSAVAGWHLMADWAIEFSAVLIPAGIGLAAFGLAALGPLRQIYTQMKDINTVSQATGKNIPPLTDSFSKLQAAVKPQVYQLFGDVLSVMGSRSGALTTLATGTGHALDVLGARMAVAITQGKGMGGVLAGGAADVAKLGDIVGNFGGTLGNVLKAMPGYAEIFLNLWDAVSKGAEALTAATIPILKVGLALHGFIVYAGLAVTAVLKLGPPVAKLAGTLYDLGLKSAASLGAFALDLVEADGAMAKFAVVGAALGAVDPLIWVAAAAAGLVGLALWLRNSRTAAQQFNAAMQQTITNAPTISAGIADMGVAAHLTSQKLADAETSLARVSAAAMKAGGTAQLSQADKGSAAYLRAAAATRVYASGLQQVTAQQSLSDSRLGRLKQTYGSSTAALGALTAAGVTNAQWQQRGANGWAIIAQMVTATTAAYKIMGVSTGAAGNDLQILGNQASQSYTAIQTLNTGLDAFIGNLTKTQGSFDTLALGNVTLRDNFSKANEAAKLTTHTLGGVKTGSTLAGAAMDGLSQASLTLNQAFGTQVSNVEALLDTWRVAGIAQNLQTQGTKDAIAPLLKYAAGSQEARAQLAGLAEEAGFNLAPTLRNLTGWLGNTHGATQKLKDITNQATLQEALLTSGMQAQGQYIASTLIGDINTAILKYHGVASAASAYGTAMAHFGPQSTQATTALDLMNQKIIASGRAMRHDRPDCRDDRQAGQDPAEESHRDRRQRRRQLQR